MFRLFCGFVILSLLLPALLAGAAEPGQERSEDKLHSWAGPSATETWLHFGYDSAYTVYNPIESTIGVDNVTQLRRRWGLGCDDGYFAVIERSPAIYNGKLYTTHALPTTAGYCKLLAYDAQTGEELWRFGSGCDYDAHAGQPVVSEDGVVFYLTHSYPTYLYALDADSGTELWQAPIGFDLSFGVDTALVTVDETNGVVYLVEEESDPRDGKLFALDKQTGQIVWYKGVETGDVSFKGEYVLLGDGKIFALYDEDWLDYRMLRMDASTQEIEINFVPVGTGNVNPEINQYTLCNDKLIVAYTDRYDPVSILVAYDIDSPGPIWQEEYSTITGKFACNTVENRLYVPTEPYLYALDAATGEEVWKYMGYDAVHNPSLANGVVYFLSETNMYAIDEDTMEQLFSYPLGYEAEPASQVAIADGMLYFSGNGGTCDLFALGLPQPPNVPNNPVPADGESDVPTSQVLSWQGSDPDGDPVTYTVAFGISDPPPVVAPSVVMTSYNPGPLDTSTTYYWAVTATDALSETAGPVWSFTTGQVHRVYLPMVVCND